MNLKIIVTLVFLLLISASIPLTSSSFYQMDNDIIICGSLNDITRVSIQPSTQTVEEGEMYVTVDIYVEPSEIITGVGFDIYFDPTLIQAESVSPRWDLFDWPLVFPPTPGFDYGNIDNINGKITGVMGIPMYPAEDPGMFCYIEFTAQHESGVSYLNLEEVIVVNIMGEPLPLEVYDGQVIIDGPPEISDVVLIASEPLDTEPGFGWENVSCTVTDDIGVHIVKIIITYPYGTILEHTMTNILSTNVYYYDTTFTVAGYYMYSIWANNTEGNTATSSYQIFVLPMNEDVDIDGCITEADLIFPLPPPLGGWYGPPGWMREDVNNNGHFPDLDDILQIIICYGQCLPPPPWQPPPEITNVMLTTSDPLDTDVPFGWENFSCIVTDNTDVDEVKLFITCDTTTEYPMFKDGDEYYCNITISTDDDYSYYVWANDTSGNENRSEMERFYLPANEDVDMNGHVYFDELVAIVWCYGETGPPGWIREDVNNDGKVYFDDLVDVVMKYGEEW